MTRNLLATLALAGVCATAFSAPGPQPRARLAEEQAKAR